jgi:hypothetical protein
VRTFIEITLAVFLWNCTLIVIIWQISSGSWLRPYYLAEADLLRILSDAYLLVVVSSPSKFRSLRQRREVVERISRAAQLIEGRLPRALARGDVQAKALVLAQLQIVSTGLREKIKWLATPTADTQKNLTRELGIAVMAAATGNFEQIGKTDLSGPLISRSSWLSYVVLIIRWSIIALGPAVGLSLLWNYLDASTKSLGVQFAALCFVVGTFSSVDPGARDKVNTIVGTGSALFGWDKAKT